MDREEKMKYVDIEDLNNIRVDADIYSAVRQIWENGREWLGFLNTPRQRSGFSLFLSDVKGEYSFKDRESIIVGKGDIVYIPKGEQYSVRFCGGGYDPDLYTVNFNIFDSDGEELLLGERLTVYREALTPHIADVAARLSDAVLFENGELKLRSLFFGLLFEISQALTRHRSEYNPVARGAELLCEEWNLSRKISEYAELCGISEGCFYLYFKEIYGKSPVEYRNGMRINYAISLLINTDLLVTEIAERCGFEDPYYFSRLFKKTIGVSPRDYRRKMLE